MQLAGCAFLQEQKMTVKLLKMRGYLGEKGATAVEYAIIVGLIAVGIISAVTLIKTNASGKFNEVATSIAGPS